MVSVSDQIESYLDSISDDNSMRHLFWDILEFSPEELSISKIVLSKKCQKFVEKLDLFGSRGAHKLIVATMRSGMPMSSELLRRIARNLRTSYPYGIFLFTNYSRRDWRLAYSGNGRSDDQLLIRLGVPGSSKVISRMFTKLADEAEDEDTLGLASRFDRILLDSKLRSYSRRLDMEVGGIFVDRNYQWWCELASRSSLLTSEEEKSLFQELEELWPRERRNSFSPGLCDTSMAQDYSI